MRAQDVAKIVMRSSGITQGQLAETLGKAGPSTVSMILSGRNMKVDDLLVILNECGYDLIVKSRDGVRPDYLIGDGEMEQPKRSEKRLRAIVHEMVVDELKRMNAEKKKDAVLKIQFADEDEQEPDL